MNPLWLVLFILCILAWLYTVSWASDDAVGVGMNFHRWNTILVAAGVPGVLLALGVHASLVLLTPAIVVMAFAAYVGKRNANVPERYKLFGPHHRAKIMAGLPLLNKLAEEPEEFAGDVALPVTNADGQSLKEYAETHPDLNEAYVAFSEAVLRGAATECSALHYVPHGENYVLRYSLDGMLHNVQEVPIGLAQQLMAAVSQFVGLADEGRMRPGTATISGQLPTHGEIDIGVQIRAQSGKPSLTLSMPNWTRELHLEGLEALGMHDSLIRRIEAVLDQDSGALVLCSPPRQGKTTSLFGVSAQIDFFTTDIFIIEKDEELPIQHVRRFPIPEDRSFTQFFEEVMREDPDDIVLANLETPEQAERCLNYAAQEGLFLTAMTGNSASEAVLRLSRMAGQSLVNQTVTCVIAQRLVRTLCVDCRETVEPNPGLLKKLNLNPEDPGEWYRPVGCESCLGTGYRGRTGIFAMLILTEQVKEVLASGEATEAAIRNAAGKVALRTLYQDGLSKVVAGMTTLDEIRRVIKK